MSRFAAVERGSSLNSNATLGLSIVPGLDVDEDELEQLARSLRAELLELDVDAVEPAAAGPAPDDARAVEALLTGALVVRLAQDTQAISSVVQTVRGWLGETRSAAFGSSSTATSSN